LGLRQDDNVTQPETDTPNSPTMHNSPDDKKKVPRWRRWWAILLAGMVVAGTIVGIVSGALSAAKDLGLVNVFTSPTVNHLEHITNPPSTRPACGSAFANQASGAAGRQTVGIWVRKSSSDCWRNTLDVSPGDVFEILVNYTNSTVHRQNNVVLRAGLPASMSLIPDTTNIANANNPNGLKLNPKWVITDGVNIGNYSSNSNAWILYKFRLNGSATTQCGLNPYAVDVQQNSPQESESASAGVIYFRAC
jgi:hypothetical protein